jgi:hypothetical protein
VRYLVIIVVIVIKAQIKHAAKWMEWAKGMPDGQLWDERGIVTNNGRSSFLT